MRLIPSMIFESKSSAEDTIFDLFEKIEQRKDWVILHSLNLPEHHRHKLWSEIDFVIICPLGIYALEVKGGGVKCANGIWYGIDRSGVQHKKKESPYDQVRDAHFALKKSIYDHQDIIGVDRFRFGWMVIFPDITENPSGLETPEEITLNRIDCLSAGAFKRSIDKAIDYWRTKGEEKWLYEANPKTISDVVRVLRPDFELVPKLSWQAETFQDKLVSMTMDQYEKLDAIAGAERVICTGGAGTGKSFLALQEARTEVAKGRSVIIAVSTEMFSAYLKDQILLEGIRIFSINELKKSEEDTNFQPADTLIVDEGQDLLTIESLIALGKAVKGDMENGRWRWFMDHNNQAGIENEVDDEVSKLLSDFSSTPLSLKRNCRNTPEIVTQTQLTTGADIGKAESKGAGLPPKYKIAKSDEDALEILESLLNKWNNEEIPPGDIAILSSKKFNDSIASSLNNKWKSRIKQMSLSNINERNSKKIIFSTIRDFKGLERNFIVVVDLDDTSLRDNHKSLFYVGMTRANYGLWLIVTPKLQKIIDAAHRENALLMSTRKGKS